MHIQLAHFYTVDPFLAFFATACLYFLVAIPDPRTSSSPHNISHTHSRAATAYLLLAGAMAGFAIGSKFAAILLLLPIAVSCGLMATRPRRHRLLLFFFALWVGFLAFFLTNPFAVLDQTCTVISPAIKIGVAEIPALNWRSCYLQNVVTQGAIANGGTIWVLLANTQAQPLTSTLPKCSLSGEWGHCWRWRLCWACCGSVANSLSSYANGDMVLPMRPRSFFWPGYYPSCFSRVTFLSNLCATCNP